MAGNSKSGTSETERERFMRAHGYEELRDGKGSHGIWFNPRMRDLVRQHPEIEMPENLRSVREQNQWAISLPDNPGLGTWHRIQKQVEWCSDTLARHGEAEAAAERRAEIKREFRAAIREVTEWRKLVKHWVKAGLPLKDAPKAPESYHGMSALKGAAFSPK